jgi:hypothetical protein
MMWAGLYGPFVPIASTGEGEVDADAYKLFVARSVALGWLSHSISDVTAGLWGMNDALVGRMPDDVGGNLAGWFQVDVTDPGRALPVLPIQPFLACIDAVVRQLGTLDLRAVRLLAPPAPSMATGQARAMGHLANAAGGFVPAGSVSVVELTIDGGQDATVVQQADMIVGHVQELHQQVFGLERWSAGTIIGEAGPPGVADGLWGGPPLHRVTLTGTLMGWNLDVVAWLMTFVAHACHISGVGSSTVLSIARS